MRFDGEFDVPARIERVWETLLDIETISQCMPGAIGVRQTGPDQYAGALRVRLGPISTNFELTGVVAANAADRTYKADINGRERLTGTLTEAAFAVQFQQLEVGTHASYQIDFTLRGKLGQLGQAVYQDVAQKMTRQAIDCLRERLSSEEPGQ